MRNRREVAALALVLIVLAVVGVVVDSQREAAEGDLRLSTFLSGPHGARALLLTMEELGVPVERELVPWGNAGREGALVVLGPIEPPTPREIEALTAWIEAGGTLVYGARIWPDPVAETFGLQFRSSMPDSLGALAAVRWQSGRAVGVPARPEAHRWTRGLDSVPGFHQVFDDAAPALEAEGLEVLLRAEDGQPAVVAFPRGEGTVVAWSDGGVLENARLAEGGAALLFARVAGEATGEGGIVAFDEFHLGYREGGGPVLALRRFLTGTGPGRWLLQVAAAGLALLLLAGARLGEPVRALSFQRRSPLEHVEAVAGAYGKAGARRTAKRLLAAGMNRQLHVRRTGRGEPWVPAASEESPGAGRLRAEWERGDGGDLVAFSDAIDRYIAEVRGWK